MNARFFPSTHMKFQIKGIDITITLSFERYILDKLGSLERVLAPFLKKGGECLMNVEVARTTRHHKKGEHIRASATCSLPGTSFHASRESFDARSAIDMIKDELHEQIVSAGEKKTSQYLRGARLLKRLTRMSPLAWFGWKKGTRDREEGM